MREIKFRAKSGTQWRYGDLYHNERGEHVIYEPKTSGQTLGGVSFDGWRIKVEPKTVGQYTGLKDCEGREIYEGDVIRSDLLPHMRTTVCNGCVEYRNGAFYVEYIDHTYANLGDLIFYSGTSSTVIGNIYDNPELLEAKNARD